MVDNVLQSGTWKSHSKQSYVYGQDMMQKQELEMWFYTEQMVKI